MKLGLGCDQFDTEYQSQLGKSSVTVGKDGSPALGSRKISGTVPGVDFSKAVF